MENNFNSLDSYICYSFMKLENISDNLLEIIGKFSKMDSKIEESVGEVEEVQVPYPILSLNPSLRYIGLYYTINNERVWIGYDCKKSSDKPFCVSIQQRNESDFSKKLEKKEIEYNATFTEVDKDENHNGYWYTIYIGDTQMGISQLLQERDEILKLVKNFSQSENENNG